MVRVFILMVDSLGIGVVFDVEKFGDVGVNIFVYLFKVYVEEIGE